MAVLVHIADRAEWELAKEQGEYRADSLEERGFIHFSHPEQVIRVADHLYRGRVDLVLLCVDPTLLTAEIREEDGGGGELFPHLYGPLNIDAVTSVEPFRPADDGTLRLPTRNLPAR